MRCPTCHANLPDGAQFCNVCGAALPQEMACAQCGEAVHPGQKFCIRCGAWLDAAPPGPAPNLKTAPTVVLGRLGRGHGTRWWLWLIPLGLAVALVVAVFALDLPGKLAGSARPEETRAARSAETPDATETADRVADVWARAQERQAAGEAEEAHALLAELRAMDAGFKAAEVSSLLAAVCADLARQAELVPDPAAAQRYWSCVLDEQAGNEEAAVGQRRAELYLAGQVGMDAGRYPEAIAAWEELNRSAAGYADAADRLYLAYVAHAGMLCAGGSAEDLQAGREQLELARSLAPGRPEAEAKLAACQAPTPLPGPLQGVVADEVTNLRVRSGPGAGYLVLGKLTAGDAVTVTGRTADAAWLQVEAAPDRQGWVSSTYITVDAATEAVPVVPAAPMPARLMVAQASTDFSPQQGYREWFYLISTEPGSLKFVRMPWDGDRWYRWRSDAAHDPEMRLSNAGGYPSRAYDVARLWVSPYEGQLHITGKAYKEPNAGRGGNGVLVRIVRNKEVLWEVALGGADTTGVAFDLSVASRSGDEFYFIINALGDDTADNTVFNPKIELLHPEAAAGLPAPVPWPEPTPQTAAATPIVAPTAAPTRRPVAALCFEPRLRHYEEHKGCCAEVAGVVYNRQGQPYGPAGALLHIEGPPASDRYVRDFGVDPGGGYTVTALSVDKYTIWLAGPNIRSRRYEVQYDDWAKIRIIVDFYQVACW